MAFATGTATSAENLISLFRTFITSNAGLTGESPSQAWTELAYTNVSGNHELYLRGPGLANADNIYVNINLFNDISAATDAWSWSCYGATGYDNSLPIENQPGVSPNPRVMPLFNASMPYWFFANGRRFIIIARVTASVYVGCYCGFILPFSPSLAALEYTYPMYIGASGGQTGFRFSTTTSNQWGSFYDPANSGGEGSGYIFSSINQWVEARNWGTTSKLSSNPFANPLAMVEPYTRLSGGSTTTTTSDVLQVENLEPALGTNNYVLTDCTISRPSVNINLRDRYGVLDGVAHISGIAQSAENTVTEGSDTYTVFQTHDRTGQGDFVAIKQ